MTENRQPITVRLPESLYEQLRRLAYETHKPMSRIVTEAISDAMKRQAVAQ
jgi:predicted transcriptional regulator